MSYFIFVKYDSSSLLGYTFLYKKVNLVVI